MKFAQRRMNWGLHSFFPSSRPYADIQVKFTRMVFENLMGTVFIGFFGAITGTLFMARHYGDCFLGWLAIAMLVACAARMIIIYRFNRQPRLELRPEEAFGWEIMYGVATLIYTATLAINQLYCFKQYDVGARIWVTIGTFAFCSGITGRLALRPWIAQASGLIVLVSLGFSVLQSNDVLVQGSAIFVGLYAYLYCISISAKFNILVENMRSQRELAALADHDALTGLSNRRHFESRLALACAGNDPFAILFIDLDKFKAVNDTFGHATGDALLQSVAQRLREAVEPSDLIARLGGDEFAVLQSFPTEETARTLAARINRDMATIFEIDGNLLRIGASIGVRLVRQEESDATALLRSADVALYEVKRIGGSGFAVAEQARPSGSYRIPVPVMLV